MKIAVIGTGYVGLVTGTCFADLGNEVVCVDIDENKVRRLRDGQIPIYEPGLAELVHKNSSSERLTFTTKLAEAVDGAKLIYLAVGTPSAEDGSADLTALWAVVKALGPCLPQDSIVVTKSTVPVGTNAGILSRLKESTGRDCHVASNPEFLREGAAIDDFMNPDRVVVGARCKEVADVLHDLYAPVLGPERPFLVMSPESAEMTKYAANALLSTKISFINELANLCERTEADINDVRLGIGYDHRIGFEFLFPGVGYGGSCFPKDVRALAKLAREKGIEPRILDAVDTVNTLQRQAVAQKILRYFSGQMAGKKIALWGLAFKPRTDDIREAPSLITIEMLLAQGAKVRVYDPEAMENVQRIYGDRIEYARHPIDTVTQADALAILTEWPDFRHPDIKQMKRMMKAAVIFDGRNIFDPQDMSAQGFAYFGIGRGERVS